jgi:hypothetical protein
MSGVYNTINQLEPKDVDGISGDALTSSIAVRDANAAILASCEAYDKACEEITKKRTERTESAKSLVKEKTNGVKASAKSVEEMNLAIAKLTESAVDDLKADLAKPEFNIPSDSHEAEAVATLTHEQLRVIRSALLKTVANWVSTETFSQVGLAIDRCASQAV